jgi:hypothetical protein
VLAALLTLLAADTTRQRDSTAPATLRLTM